MTNEHEIWCYDEPHESGGNCHVTMTRRQAIEWMRKRHPSKYFGPVPDNAAFFDWVSINWAYREVKQ